MTESSMRLWRWTTTLVDSSERRTAAPPTMQRTVAAEIDFDF